MVDQVKDKAVQFNSLFNVVAPSIAASYAEHP
jgi:hypothetical protein